MKDKIAELYYEISQTDFQFMARVDASIVLAQAILDLIAKELPKEKEAIKDYYNHSTEEHIGYQGWNDCLKDIKHKLGVE